MSTIHNTLDILQSFKHFTCCFEQHTTVFTTINVNDVMNGYIVSYSIMYISMASKTLLSQAVLFLFRRHNKTSHM